jgi:hypothetical protein
VAEVVLGLATSHSPHVSTPPEQWYLHAESDKTNPYVDYNALLARADPAVRDQLSLEIYRAKYDACQVAIDELGELLARARVDVVVVVGDDHHELFIDDCSPAFAIYAGQEIVDVPPPAESIPPAHVPAMWSRHAATLEVLPAMPALASQVAASLCEQDFDIAVSTTQRDGCSIGHAFTFVRLRLMRERLLPIVPVFVNCYYPPNQPSARRCFAFGQALRKAIASWDSSLRVALVASGGLTHFVVDEGVDNQVLAGITAKNSDLLTRIPNATLTSGTSEIRNWIVAAGALDDLPARVINYTPAYRSPAGTGCGMAFVAWGA